MINLVIILHGVACLNTIIISALRELLRKLTKKKFEKIKFFLLIKKTIPILVFSFLVLVLGEDILFPIPI